VLHNGASHGMAHVPQHATASARVLLQHAANMELRMKYVDQPDKFLESEVDLDEAVKNCMVWACLQTCHLGGLEEGSGCLILLRGFCCRADLSEAVANCMKRACLCLPGSWASGGIRVLVFFREMLACRAEPDEAVQNCMARPNFCRDSEPGGV
jgi:hypothetical protein